MARPRDPFWTPEVLAYITENYHQMTAQQIAVNLGPPATVYSVRNRYRKMGLSKRPAGKPAKGGYVTWTPEEEAFVAEHYNADMTSIQIAAKLGKTPEAVRTRAAKKLGVMRRMTIWTPEMDHIVKTLYGVISEREIRQRLGVSRAAIFHRAQRMGITARSNRAAKMADALAGDPQMRAGYRILLAVTRGMLTPDEAGRAMDVSPVEVIRLIAAEATAGALDARTPKKEEE